MDKARVIFLGGIASLLLLPGAQAQGLLGRSYARFDLGYERRDVEEGYLSGGVIGLEVNAPTIARRPHDPGLDFNLGGSAMLASEDEPDLRMHEWRAEALLRGYVPLRFGLTPYAAAGWDWAQNEVEEDGVSVTERGSAVPLEVGFQLAAGRVMISPFARYGFALNRDRDDFWSAGGTLGFWLAPRWALTGRVIHTEMDDDQERLTITGGFVYSY